MECKQCGFGRIKSGFFGKPKCDNCGAAPPPEDLKSQEVGANNGNGEQADVASAKARGKNKSASSTSADSPSVTAEQVNISAEVSPVATSHLADLPRELPESRGVAASSTEDSGINPQDNDELSEPPKWIWIIPWLSAAGAVGWLVYWCNLWLLNEDMKLRGQVHSSTLSHLYLGIAIGGLVPFVYAFLKTINRQAIRDALRENSTGTGASSVTPMESAKAGAAQESEGGNATSSSERSVMDAKGSKTTLNDALISFWVEIRPMVGVLAIIGWEIFWFYLMVVAEERPSARLAASRYRGEHSYISLLGMLCLTMVLFGWVPLLAIFAIGPKTTTVSDAKGDKNDDETLGTDSDAAGELLKSLEIEDEVLDVQDVLAVDDGDLINATESDVGIEPERNPYTGEILQGKSADDVRGRVNDQLAAASGMSKVDSGGCVKGAAITFGLLIFGGLFLNLMDSTGILSAILLPVGLCVFVIYLFVSGSLRY